jgi:hypothetical protein
MTKMHVAVVIPCLNESELLPITCASLGFGAGASVPDRSSLILVDNGSTDSTPDIAKGIQAHSPDGSVVLAYEPERGYIPPRHRGNLVARTVAQSLELSESEVLILQADADTFYSVGYIDAMRSAADVASRGFVLEACTTYPDSFRDKNAEYLTLCEEIDFEFEDLLVNHPDEVILDDKAVGYRLDDYFAWEGHKREYLANGDEIYSETTRLYLRAKTFGGRCVSVEDAWAVHSVRKILAEPTLDLATAGFPRNQAWVRWWLDRSAGISSIAQLLSNLQVAITREALAWRRYHLLALFGVLPLHVARTLGRICPFEQATWTSHLDLPCRSVDTLRSAPGVLIEDALDAVAQTGDYEAGPD